MSRRKEDRGCVVCGEKYSACVNGKPYCNKHYQSMVRYGKPYGKKRTSTNQFIIEGELLKIITRSGKTILADIEDSGLLKRYSWCISKTGYAVANTGKKIVRMHRFILGIDEAGKVVDHINHNKLDNRKENLRICTQKENSRNKTPTNNLGVLGIRITENGTYNVRITVNRKGKHIGNFKTIEDAITARKMAEKKYHGEFGNTK